MFAHPRSLALTALLCAAPGSVYAAEAEGAPPEPAAAGRNPAAAQALFEEAQRRVAAGDYAVACPQFKASYALDPGGGTLLNLADCLERQGRTASAWSTFKDALVLAQRDGRSERAEYAQQHIRALQGRLVYLTVQVPPASLGAGLALEVDGTPLVAAAWGTALPVDPGEHVVRAQAPGFEPFEHGVTLAASAGSRQTFEVPPLRALASPEPEPVRGPVDAAPAMLDAEPRYPARNWGLLTGGVGLVALGVGGYFGVRAFAHWQDREDACVGGCTSEAKSAGDDANQAASRATLGVGAGVVLLAAATVLFFYSTDAEVEPQAAVASRLWLTATDHGAAVSWGGRF